MNVLKITNLIDAVINNGSKDYDPNFIRSHVEKLTLNFRIHKLIYNKYLNLNFVVLNLNQF